MTTASGSLVTALYRRARSRPPSYTSTRPFPDYFGDYALLDYWIPPWSAVAFLATACALFVLIGVVVTGAGFPLSHDRSGPVEIVAKVGPMLDTKNVQVEDRAKCIKTTDISYFKALVNCRFNFAFKRGAKINVSGMERDSETGSRFGRSAWNCQVFCLRQWVFSQKQDRVGDQIKGRSLPGILNANLQFGNLIGDKIGDALLADFRRDISPQLLMFHLSSRLRLLAAVNSSTDARYHNGGRENCIKDHSFASTYGPDVALAFILCGVIAGGVFLAFKGLDGGSDRMLFGGWLAAVTAVCIGTVWIIVGHLPFFSENVSAPPGIDASAPCYSSTENIRVVPVVVSELKFGNIERHVLGADLVERADNAALQDRPETFNRVGVNGTNDVLMSVVIDSRVREFFEVMAVAGPRVGCQQTNLIGHGLVHKVHDTLRGDALQNLGNDFAFAADRANDFDLTATRITGTTAALVPMFVLVLPADVSLVHLNDASELVGLVFAETGADTVAHVERSPVAPEAHVAHDLECAHSLLAGQHEVDDLEPVFQGLVRVLEDRSDQNREPIAARLGALGTLPMEGPVSHRINVDIPATRAMDAVGPAPQNEVVFAGILIREHVTKLLICKLFYRLDAGHIGLPYPMEAI